MLIEDYNLPETNKSVLRIGNTAEVLREPRLSSEDIQPPSLVVWRQALRAPEIDEAMKRTDWPVRFLSSLIENPAWTWKAQHSNQASPIFDRSEILELTEKASGKADSPHGNLVTKLSLRTYQDAASELGGYEWWQQQNSSRHISDAFTRNTFLKIKSMLGQARDIGADFYVERLALIIAKDNKSPLTTLTPTLHADESYGFRETALCSLLEYGYNPFGGAVFLPTTRMSALEKLLPITMNNLMNLLPEVPMVKSYSGDVVYYDGMLGQDGIENTENGTPHISPDIPGVSSRLVILMRNKKVPFWACG